MARSSSVSSGGTAGVRHDAPGPDELIAELAAGLDEERGGAHGDVADFELEDLLGRRASPSRRRIGSRVFCDDRFGEGARGVVRAAAAAFVGGLEDEAALGHGRGRGLAVDLFVQRGEQVVHGGGGL